MLFLEIIFGSVAGYLAASVCESYCHRMFGHPSRWLRKQFRQHRWCLGFLRAIVWSHAIVHHRLTFRSRFDTQFSSPDVRDRVISQMGACSRRSADATQFGLTITLASVVLFMGPPLILLSPLWFFSPVAWLSGSSVALVPPLLSMWIHPLIHADYQQASKTPGLLGWVMRTKYARCVIRHHWLHHQQESVNFNLLLVGDYLLGTHKRASEADRQEMERQGIPLH